MPLTIESRCMLELLLRPRAHVAPITGPNVGVMIPVV